MKLLIIPKIFVFILTLISFPGFASGEPSLLYKSSSFVELEKYVSEISQQVKQQHGKPEILEHAYNLINILITAQLQIHPEYIPSLLKKFNGFSPEVKLAFAKALAAMEQETELNKLNYSLPMYKKPMCINSLDQIDLTVLKKQQGSKLIPNTADYLWAAFEATGEDKYLTKILSYLASEPVMVRTLAFEMLNREKLGALVEAVSGEQNPKTKKENLGYSDIENAIEELSKKDPSYSLEGLISYKVVLWSMQSQRNHHPEIESKVQKILKQNPKLDYRKDVKL